MSSPISSNTCSGVHRAILVGEDLWSSVEKEIDFVPTHPNGWVGFQQSQMQRAAILARLIPDTKEGHARIFFVTEGEARLHFAIQNGLPVEDMKDDDGIVIVDAGGGTIDVSAYSRDRALGMDIFKEIAIPECHFHGSIFVSIHTRVFLTNCLVESPFIDDLDHIVRCFDATTKLRFRNSNEPGYIRFGSMRDNDYAHGIRFGQVKLDGSDICKSFKLSVKCITEAVMEKQKSAQGRVTHVLLIGGFASSDWLHNEVYKVLKPLRLDVVRPGNRVDKAVPDGAIFFYLNNFVESRVSKTTDDCVILPFYASNDPEHLGCSASNITWLLGRIVIPNRFCSPVLPEAQVPEKNLQEFRLHLHHESASEISYIRTTISHHRGELASSQRTDVEVDMYEDIYQITVYLSHVNLQTLQRRADGKPGTYYQVDWEIILLLGLTEFRFHYAWAEDGIEKRGPAAIVYAPQFSKK